VFSLDFGATTVTINSYVDPTPGLATPDVAASVANYSGPTFAFDSIRIEGGLGTSATLNFDEIRIGDTFGSVSPVRNRARLRCSGVTAVGWVTYWRRTVDAGDRVIWSATYNFPRLGALAGAFSFQGLRPRLAKPAERFWGVLVRSGGAGGGDGGSALDCRSTGATAIWRSRRR